jgi:predicted DNA-binding protein YlxM (UPF0122 family)
LRVLDVTIDISANIVIPNGIILITYAIEPVAVDNRFKGLIFTIDAKMILSREEKEKLVLDLYYNKSYTYRQITKELRMSPNQIRDIIKRHEEKNNAIANKRKELSLSSKAYKLFSKGKTNEEVAIKLDIPQPQVTQFRLEFCKLQDLDSFESLYRVTNGQIASLWKLYQELVIKRGISYERVADAVDIHLNRLPCMETLYEQVSRAVSMKEEKSDNLDIRIYTLETEEKRLKRRIITLPASYNYVEDGKIPTINTNSCYSTPTQPSALPYWPSGFLDVNAAYRKEQEKNEIRGVDEGDIAD